MFGPVVNYTHKNNQRNQNLQVEERLNFSFYVFSGNYSVTDFQAEMLRIAVENSAPTFTMVLLSVRNGNAYPFLSIYNTGAGS